MRISLKAKFISVLVLLAVGCQLFGLTYNAMAQSGSASYNDYSHRQDSGGLPSQSENYIITDDSLGAFAAGDIQSNSYNVLSGPMPTFDYVMSLAPSSTTILMGNMLSNYLDYSWADGEKIYIQDIRGTGAGWTLTGWSSGFSNGATTFANDKFYWNTGAITAVSPATTTGIATGYGYMSSPVTIANTALTANDGMGVYTIRPKTSVIDPGVSGYNFSGTVTLTIS